MSDHSARPRIESVGTFVLEIETLAAVPEPTAWYRFEDATKGEGDVCLDTMGNYPGQYYLNEGTVTERASLLPHWDPTQISVDFEGNLDFGGGGVQLNGEPRGCVLIDDLSDVMDGSGDGGLAPFSVAFWSQRGDGFEGTGGEAFYNVIWPNESMLNIMGNIFEQENGPGDEDNTYVFYPAGVVSCMAPNPSGPGRQGWAVYIQGGQVVFGRHIGGGVGAPYSYELSSGDLPVMDEGHVDGKPRSQVIFCIYDGNDMYIYSSISIIQHRFGDRENPWLATMEATNELTSAGAFAIGTADLSFPFAGGWANWMQGTIDDVMCWNREITLSEMRAVFESA